MTRYNRHDITNPHYSHVETEEELGSPFTSRRMVIHTTINIHRKIFSLQEIGQFFCRRIKIKQHKLSIYLRLKTVYETDTDTFISILKRVS